MGMKKELRTTREDGNQTKERLLECAGRIIAQKGYAATTSKEICQAAGTNLAAINYHFGSRENMYRELLACVYEQFINMEFLRELAQKQVSPRERLNIFLDKFFYIIWSGKSWQTLVWARELMAPTAMLSAIIGERVIPKASLLRGLLSDYTGLDREDERLYTCQLSFLTPFLTLFLARNQTTMDYVSALNISMDEKSILANLKQFAFAGLDSFCAKNISEVTENDQGK